ncbi:MAG: LysE family translocator [Candidatus Lokiarchaeota archaeon]|nr:LysE family translocator [Candidatus Lokiarchaeota archaeon]
MFEIFLFSFLLALTGALMPGPMLTFTIYKSIKQKRGYLAGIYIVLGHATIELIFISVLLAGALLLFQNILILTIIGIVGGILLVVYGFLVIKDVFITNISIEFENSNHKGFKGNSFLGGIIVSISNPSWEIWWIVTGLGFLILNNISFANPLGLMLFFLGHELGDVVWYIPISTIAYFGGKSLNHKIFKYILLACGAFMVIFGLYMAINIIINPPKF